jgi:hypothetical protein
MLTIHGRASKGKTDNAKLMYWFPLIGAQTPDNAACGSQLEADAYQTGCWLPRLTMMAEA